MKSINDNIKAILALIIVISCFGYFFMITLLFQNDHTILSQVIIAVVGALGVATGYYFGYSQGAAKKDDTIASQQANPVVTNADTVNVK